MTGLEGMAATSPYEGVKQYPWIPDNMTSEQRGIAEEVLSKLKDKPNISYLENNSGWTVDEKLVIKYAQALGWKNSSNVASIVLESMQWRVDYGVKDIDPREFEMIARRCPFYVLGRDNLGRPIIYIDFYRFKKEDPDYCLRYMVFTMERAAQVFKAEKGEQRVLIVVDCSGSRPAPEELYSEYRTPDGKMKVGMSAASAKALARIMSVYYKDFNGCAIGSDAGFTVNALYKAVKYVVPVETREKVKILPYSEACEVLLSMALPENVIQQYGGKLELEYNALAYLHCFDFKKALFVPIDSGPLQTLSTAFSSSEVTHKHEVPAEGTADMFTGDETIFYSAADPKHRVFDKKSSTRQSVLGDERSSDGIRIGNFISINVNDQAELESRFAEMPHLQWMNCNFSNYEMEDELAFHDAWDHESNPRSPIVESAAEDQLKKSSLCCCIQ